MNQSHQGLPIGTKLDQLQRKVYGKGQLSWVEVHSVHTRCLKLKESNRKWQVWQLICQRMRNLKLGALTDKTILKDKTDWRNGSHLLLKLHSENTTTSKRQQTSTSWQPTCQRVSCDCVRGQNYWVLCDPKPKLITVRPSFFLLHASLCDF